MDHGVDIVHPHRHEGQVHFGLLSTVLANPSGDESGAVTQHSILDATSSGQINGVNMHHQNWTILKALLIHCTQTNPLPVGAKEPTRDFPFALQAAHFTPKQDESMPSSPTTVSSLTITQPTSTPHITNLILPIMNSRKHPRIVLLFKGDYGDKEEPTEWFAQFELSLPEAWTDMQQIDCFAMQLAPGQIVEEWFQDLLSMQIRDAGHLQNDPSTPTHSKRNGSWQRYWMRTIFGYGQQATMDTWFGQPKCHSLALGMRDMEGYLIEYIIEGVPNLLKDYLKCEYADWDEFLEDVQSVSSIKLKRGREDLNKEWVHLRQHFSVVLMVCETVLLC
ncbi:hypothetical protein F4604DRAFT_1679179 [Suillus subluteus]|nr:hypothetical protein F4604DRAFT_1679179 [Suillus subluteus]